MKSPLKHGAAAQYVNICRRTRFDVFYDSSQLVFSPSLSPVHTNHQYNTYLKIFLESRFMLEIKPVV